MRKQWKKEVVLIIFAIGIIALIRGEQEPASQIASRELASGKIQLFDEELTKREKIYRENVGQEVYVSKLTNIPDLFEGYTDIREEKFWINSNIRDYYRLKRLCLTEEQ